MKNTGKKNVFEKYTLLIHRIKKIPLEKKKVNEKHVQFLKTYPVQKLTVIH